MSNQSMRLVSDAGSFYVSTRDGDDYKHDIEAIEAVCRVPTADKLDD